jgi:UDP-N-acetylglucosamine 1-carboxyvinyltransferase
MQAPCRQGGHAPRSVAATGRHWLDYASVTTTENFLICAVLAAGESRLVNAVCEPHVQEFSQFLQRMGAITGGKVRVRNTSPGQFQLLDRTFAKFGVHVHHEAGWSEASAGALRVQKAFTSHMIQKVEAAPWPDIPADLLPIFIALGMRAEGAVMFWNKVYEGALGWTSELTKFGGQALVPAEVESPYISAAIALLMLAASIEGSSTIINADPIRRAHPGFVENLRSLGAEVGWA